MPGGHSATTRGTMWLVPVASGITRKRIAADPQLILQNSPALPTPRRPPETGYAGNQGATAWHNGNGTQGGQPGVQQGGRLQVTRR